MQSQPRAYIASDVRGNARPEASMATMMAKEAGPQIVADEGARQQMAAPGGANYFGKNLQYHDVYQNQTRSQTAK